MVHRNGYVLLSQFPNPGQIKELHSWRDCSRSGRENWERIDLLTKGPASSNLVVIWETLHAVDEASPRRRVRGIGPVVQII